MLNFTRLESVSLQNQALSLLSMLHKTTLLPNSEDPTQEIRQNPSPAENTLSRQIMDSSKQQTHFKNMDLLPFTTILRGNERVITLTTPLRTYGVQDSPSVH